MIIEQEEKYASDQNVDNEPVPQNVTSIWIAMDKTEWSSNPLQAHKQNLVTFYIKGVDLQQTVTSLHQMSYSSQ